MRISAIIPAYNEQKTIADVLKILKRIEDIDEIIVVSDGSRDNTVLYARNCSVKVIELPENMGKWAAIKAGLEKSSGDIVLFLDADLVGLTEMHVHDLIKPVLSDEVDMTVGIFNSGRFSTDIAHRITPYLSGQRAVKKTMLDKIDDMEINGFGMEIALTYYAEKENIKSKEILLSNLTHVMKEEKYGFLRGLGERIKMYWQIYRGIRLTRR